MSRCELHRRSPSSTAQPPLLLKNLNEYSQALQFHRVWLGEAAYDQQSSRHRVVPDATKATATNTRQSAGGEQRLESHSRPLSSQSRCQEDQQINEEKHDPENQKQEIKKEDRRGEKSRPKTENRNRHEKENQAKKKCRTEATTTPTQKGCELWPH